MNNNKSLDFFFIILKIHLDLTNKKQTMLLENKKPARNLILAEIQGKVSYDGFSLAFIT